MIRQKHPSDQAFEENPLDQEYHAILEDEIETVYLYAYTEDPEQSFTWNRDRLIGGLTVFLILVLLVGFGFAGSMLPSATPVTIQTITVPAQFVTQELQTSVAIVPTGIKTLAAMRATGVLTIYNGSFLTEQIPAGFVVNTPSGIEIATDQTVIIPPNNPPSDGIAIVPAHALVAGSQGNIAASSIDEQYGNDLTFKNLTAFTGGRDASTERYVTSHDTAKALATARAQLAVKKQAGMQARPCTEMVTRTASSLTISWTCQFVHYYLPPSLHVFSIQVAGKYVLVRVQVPLPVMRQVVK